MIFQLLLGLCGLVTSVVASIPAGPYQFVFLYYAYRIEVEAFGAQGTYIAPFCVGSLPKGDCNFDDFLKHVQPADTPKWNGATGVTDILPDVEVAAQKLRALGTETYAFTKIDFNNITRPPKPGGLAAVLDIAMARVEQALPKIKVPGKLLSGLQTAMGQVWTKRMVENYANEKKEVRKWKNKVQVPKNVKANLKAMPVITKSDTQLGFNNDQPFTRVDFEATTRKEDPVVRQLFRDYQNNPLLRDSMHQAIIQRCDDLRTRIKVLVDGC